MGIEEKDVIRAYFADLATGAANVQLGQFFGITAGPSIGFLTLAGVSAECAMKNQSNAFSGVSISTLAEGVATIDASGNIGSSTELSAAATYPADGGNNGFVDPDEVIVGWTDSTRTLTIEPAYGSFAYRDAGIRYEKTAQESIIISDVEGMHYIYYDGSVLADATAFFDDLVTEHGFIAAIYWDATNSTQLYFGDEYKHSTNMGNETHLYNHNTRGFELESGGGLTDLVVDGNGNDDEDAQFGIEATKAWDEDAFFDHSARSSTANIAVYYRSGADSSNIWRVDETASFPVLATGAGRAEFNQLSDGVWLRSEVTSNGDYLLAHVFTYNDGDRKFGVFMGQNQYGNLNAARDGAEVEVSNLITNGLPIIEFKFLGTEILQTSTTYSNTVHSRVRPPADGDYVDLRGAVITRNGVSGTVTDHETLSNLLGVATGQHYHNEETTEGNILFGNAEGGGTGDDDLVWDNTAKELSIDGAVGVTGNTTVGDNLILPSITDVSEIDTPSAGYVALGVSVCAGVQTINIRDEFGTLTSVDLS